MKLKGPEDMETEKASSMVPRFRCGVGRIGKDLDFARFAEKNVVDVRWNSDSRWDTVLKTAVLELDPNAHQRNRAELVETHV